MMKGNKRSGHVLLHGIVILSVLLFAVTSGLAKTKRYGTSIDLKKGVSVEIKQIFASPGKYEGKNIIVQGKTGQVCQTSGCWLMLTDGTDQIFVQFYTFTVRPTKGTAVRVQGVLKIQNKVPYLAAEGLEIIS